MIKYQGISIKCTAVYTADGFMKSTSPSSVKKVSSYRSFQIQLSTFETYSHVPKMPYSDIHVGTLGHAVPDSKLLNENRRGSLWGEGTANWRLAACEELKVQQVSEMHC